MAGKNQKIELREKIEVILISAADILLIVGWILLPETGIWGIVNEAIGAIIILSWSICFLISGIRKKAEDKKAFILGITMFVCIFAFGGWMSKNIVLDLMTGPMTVQLTQIRTYKSVGRSSFYYYLSGKVNSKKYRFKISTDEAVELEDAASITVSFYPRTERILEFYNIQKTFLRNNGPMSRFITS